MKRLIYTVVALFCFAATTMAQDDIPSAKPGAHYGKAVTQAGAISVQQLEVKLVDDSVFAGKVKGEVVEVCKKKGCFIRMKRPGNEDPILIRFTDYGFFMPQDIVGKIVVVEGEAKVRELSVAQQQHFAEDAGKKAVEIARITEPKADINITADGVVVVR